MELPWPTLLKLRINVKKSENSFRNQANVDMVFWMVFSAVHIKITASGHQDRGVRAGVLVPEQTHNQHFMDFNYEVFRYQNLSK